MGSRCLGCCLNENTPHDQKYTKYKENTRTYVPKRYNPSKSATITSVVASLPNFSGNWDRASLASALTNHLMNMSALRTYSGGSSAVRTYAPLDNVETSPLDNVDGADPPQHRLREDYGAGVHYMLWYRVVDDPRPSETAKQLSRTANPRSSIDPPRSLTATEAPHEQNDHEELADGDNCGKEESTNPPPAEEPTPP